MNGAELYAEFHTLSREEQVYFLLNVLRCVNKEPREMLFEIVRNAD